MPDVAEFWIDVGGTFTDCFCRTPDGRLLRRKLLSSGRTPGTIGVGSTPQSIVDPIRRADPPDFWVGYHLRLVDAAGHVLESQTVVEFHAANGRLVLANKLTTRTLVGCSYELASDEEAPLVAIRYLLGLRRDAAIPPTEVRLGTTRGTNALLTRCGAATALVTTRGFADILKIGYQNRPRLFDLDIVKPTPLTTAVIEIDERVASDGTTLIQPNDEQICAQLMALRAQRIESLAICLLHATTAPEHERRVAQIAADLGFTEISVSHRVASLGKLVSRGDTTVLDAYLTPVLRRYVASLGAALGAGRLQLMTSAGGLVDAARFTGKDSILSGPAGGVVGYARAAAAAGFNRAIGFDMGGTSTDVSRHDGRYELEFETEKAGVRVAAPMLAIETVAAGGGSICRFDGVKLVVGPESAGADPGPAAYGRGGPLTVTDLNLILGRIPLDRFSIPLDIAASAATLDTLAATVASDLGVRYDRVQLAESLLAVANATMVKAVRAISVAKGFDPRDHVLVAFGGAGGQHACAIAADLDMPSILCHPDAGLLSAYGIGLAELERHASTALHAPFDVAALADARDQCAGLAEQLSQELIADVAERSALRVTQRIDLRYRGVEAAIGVELRSFAECEAEFNAAHRRLYGYLQSGRALEIAAARVTVSAVARHTLRSSTRLPPRAAVAKQSCKAWFARQELDAQLFDRVELQPGDRIAGPAIVCEGGATVVIEPGWQGDVLSAGELLLTRSEVATTTAAAQPLLPVTNSASEPDPALLEIFNNQLAGVAEQMGHTLRNTASSVNVKERLDFSCAIFTARGQLVVNAPHIPVHLGAMGQTVRQAIVDNPQLRPGDVIVTNDPLRGGSHLPDVTVITPVHEPTSGRLLFFTASRAHHAEIGGVTPGSMPPFSRSLAEEGVLIRNFHLIANDNPPLPPGEDRGEGVSLRPRWTELRDLLLNAPYPSRDVASNLADLAAQVAANQQGARDLLALAERQSLDYVLRYMDHIQAAAERKTRRALTDVGDGVYQFADQLDDGTPIVVKITISGGSARFDFTGSGAVSSGNLNANPAIVASAAMYVLRALLAEDIPLNEGVLAPVEIVLPEGILRPRYHDDPAKCAAVVGGNVETSQRVVDVLLGALQLAAASQGTMNNLLFGDATFGYYETICGGAGATARCAGADAVHTHMTNTRLTDPEVLERRYPVRLRSFSIRSESGGAGQHRGGDGVIREIEFLRPLDVSLLTQRRGLAAPYGMAGGQPGALGRNTLTRADGSVEQLAGLAQFKAQSGDVLRIETPGGGGWGATT